MATVLTSTLSIVRYGQEMESWCSLVHNVWHHPTVTPTTPDIGSHGQCRNLPESNQLFCQFKKFTFLAALSNFQSVISALELLSSTVNVNRVAQFLTAVSMLQNHAAQGPYSVQEFLSARTVLADWRAPAAACKDSLSTECVRSPLSWEM